MKHVGHAACHSTVVCPYHFPSFSFQNHYTVLLKINKQVIKQKIDLAIGDQYWPIKILATGDQPPLVKTTARVFI